MKEKPKYRPWIAIKPPRRVLFIRLQATGDVVITLPYIQGFSKLLPDTEIDFLTRNETASIPEALTLFKNLYILKGGRNTLFQVFHALFLTPALRKRQYDFVIDLQNNRISRMILSFLSPSAWSLFDRFSPVPAGQRTAHTIQQVWPGKIEPDFNLSIRNKSEGVSLLTEQGWKAGESLVILNPAGFLKTRNWPLDHYVKFARLWLDKHANTRFLVLGLERIKPKAEYLHARLKDKLIDLTGKTTPAAAFSIIQKATLVLTEDSGLMHMAWVSGKATIALFGSSRSDWSRPLGTHAICLNSSDLECGECMLETCKFGDVHCLSRFTPEIVLEESEKLLKCM